MEKTEEKEKNNKKQWQYLYNSGTAVNEKKNSKNSLASSLLYFMHSSLKILLWRGQKRRKAISERMFQSQALDIILEGEKTLNNSRDGS